MTEAADADLYLAAQFLDSVEQVRIATENRVRDRERRGLTTRERLRWERDLGAMRALERTAILDLTRMLAAHPLGPWVQGVHGIGEKSCARFLATVGNPVWNGAEGRPRRGPGELFAYLGQDVRNGKAPRRQRGVASNWNGQARARLKIITDAIVTQPDSPFHERYRRAKAYYVERDGETERPIVVDARARRIAAKEFLKALFNEALRLGLDKPAGPLRSSPPTDALAQQHPEKTSTSFGVRNA